MAQTLLDELPHNFDVGAVRARFPVAYLESLNVVLQQEVQRYNVLLDTVRASLNDLLAAL